MILLDTHALVWLSEGNKQLGLESKKMIDQALKLNELYVSPISFWEIAMLVEKGRINLSLSIDAWRNSLLDGGLQECEFSGGIAVKAALLHDFHGDPADRMIVSTATALMMTLCTADKKILDWEHDLLCINAKK